MRFYLSVLLLSLYVIISAADMNIYTNGLVASPFGDYSWAQTKNPSDSTVQYNGNPTYSFAPSYWSGAYFVCQDCINATRTNSIVVEVNFGDNPDVVVVISVVRNTNSGTVNYPPLLTAPSLSKFATSTVAKNTWVRCVIPFTTFGLGNYDGIQFIGSVNSVQSTVYIGSVIIGEYASNVGYLTINGVKSFALGTNLPTTPNNFGRDFGTNAWGYAGVNTVDTFSNASAIFKQVNKNYGNAVRWNLFTDARAGIVFDTNGYPTALNPQVFNDIDQAVAIAKGYKVSILFSIIDITFFQKALLSGNVTLGGHASVVTDTAKTAAFIKNILVPILQRYSSNPYIFAFEIMNNVEKVLSNLPQGSPAPSTAFDLVTMSQFWTFANSVATRIKAITTKQVTLGSLSLKWINLYTPTYAAQNNLPSLSLDFYSVGYDTWMDSVSYFNDSDLGTVNASPFQQFVGELDLLEGATVIVNAITTPSTNMTDMYNTLLRNGYGGVFENFGTISWGGFRAFGQNNVNSTGWSGFYNPIFPAINTTKTQSATANVTKYSTSIPSDVTFIPTYIYTDTAVSAPWEDFSWAQSRNPAADAYVYSGTSSYLLDPSNYDGLYFYNANGINTGTDFALVFYINGGDTLVPGSSNNQIIKVALIDSKGNKAGGDGIPLSAVGVSIMPQTWSKVAIPFSNFPLGVYSGIQIYGGAAGVQYRVYIDQIEILSYPPRSTSSPSNSTDLSSIVSSPAPLSAAPSSVFTYVVIFVALMINMIYS